MFGILDDSEEWLVQVLVQVQLTKLIADVSLVPSDFRG